MPQPEQSKIRYRLRQIRGAWLDALEKETEGMNQLKRAIVANLCMIAFRTDTRAHKIQTRDRIRALEILAKWQDLLDEPDKMAGYYKLIKEVGIVKEEPVQQEAPMDDGELAELPCEILPRV